MNIIQKCTVWIYNDNVKKNNNQYSSIFLKNNLNCFNLVIKLV